MGSRLPIAVTVLVLLAVSSARGADTNQSSEEPFFLPFPKEALAAAEQAFIGKVVGFQDQSVPPEHAKPDEAIFKVSGRLEPVASIKGTAKPLRFDITRKYFVRATSDGWGDPRIRPRADEHYFVGLMTSAGTGEPTAVFSRLTQKSTPEFIHINQDQLSEVQEALGKLAVLLSAGNGTNLLQEFGKAKNETLKRLIAAELLEDSYNDAHADLSALAAFSLKMEQPWDLRAAFLGRVTRPCVLDAGAWREVADLASHSDEDQTLRQLALKVIISHRDEISGSPESQRNVAGALKGKDFAVHKVRRAYAVQYDGGGYVNFDLEKSLRALFGEVQSALDVH